MKAIIESNAGESKSLEIKEVADPSLEPNQLLVKVKAFALNRADLLQRKGLYPPPSGESSILGLEIAGEVVKKQAITGGKQGKSPVDDFQIGDRVFGLVGGGAYAELCPLHAQMAIKIPKEIN